MEKIEYDPVVLQAYASTLYQQAKNLVFWSTCRWAVVWFLVGFVAVAASSRSRAVDDEMYRRGVDNPAGAALVVGGVLAFAGGLVGRSRAQNRAWALRLDAQRLLCQYQIEQNTRASRS